MSTFIQNRIIYYSAGEVGNSASILIKIKYSLFGLYYNNQEFMFMNLS